MTLMRVLLLLPLFYTGWCADPKVVIKQTFPYTYYKDGHKRMVVHKDKDSFLACVVDNKPADKKVQWLLQMFDTERTITISTDTDTQNAFKYQIDKPAANNWRLRIQNIQPSDQALYICRVQLTSQQNANDSRIISVVQPPQIIDIMTSSDTTVEEGFPEELTCNASGIPRPIISWQMAGGGVLPTGGRELIQYNLPIPAARKEHKGDYKCVARNSAGTDVRRIYLNVKFHPRVVPESTEVFQAIGYDKELKCEASGNPIPTEDKVRWHKIGVPLVDKEKYSFEYYFGSNYVLMKLIIHNIQRSDYGQYNCYAENTEGSEEHSVILVESPTPTYDRTELNKAAILSFSLTTVIMLIATCILHIC